MGTLGETGTVIQSESDDKMKCFNETKTVSGEDEANCSLIVSMSAWYCLTVTRTETKMFHLLELDLVFRCRDHLPPHVILAG